MVSEQFQARYAPSRGATEKVRIFQAHVARLAMETGIWVAKCRVVRPNDTRGLPSRQKKNTSDAYSSELSRPGLKKMPITERFYVGLPPSKARGPARTMEDSLPRPGENVPR